MRKRMGVCLMLQMMLTYGLLLLRLAAMEPAAPASAEASYLFEVAVAPTAAPETHMPGTLMSETPLPETPAPTAEAAAAQATGTPTPAADMLLQVEVIRVTAEPPAWTGKRVLIYHTHTWEAYQQTDAARYQETEKWRTKDDRHNVVAVGRALTACLTALGMDVVHDETAFEPPNLDDAYDRSLDMLSSRQAAGERYDLYIDLHRDALASTSTIRQTVMTGGGESARFMVLVGQGTTGGYDEKPDWEANLAIARRITSSLNGQCDGLARDVKIKTGRFNQHVADCCVLIECGVNTNTLEQVLTGVPYLAQAIADALAE